MRYIGIIILLILSLTLLLLTGCMINTVTPEPAEDPETVYPQQWATGTGTAENPWANDCIKKAYDVVPAGGTIFLRAGYYDLPGLLVIYKKVNIIGEGMGKSILVTSMADEDAIRIQSDYVTLKGFTIDADSQTDYVDYLSCITVANTSPKYAILEDLELKNAGEHGANYGGLSHSTFKNIYAHDNAYTGMHGFHTEGTGVYNTFQNIYCWDNGTQGFGDGTDAYIRRDSHNVYDNIQAWGNGTYGIALGRQNGVILTNSVAHGNTGMGMYLRYISESNISNCKVTNNGTKGLYLMDSSNVNFTNIIVKNNGLTEASSGINLYGTNNVTFTSCQSYDEKETPLQTYGLRLVGTNTGTSLLNCKLTPNKEGDIYNPAGAVVTVITEKMLAKF